MSASPVTGSTPAKPPVATTTEETTSENPNVEAPKYTSFSKALIPAPKADKWYMTALKVLACITVVPMLGALIMDALRGAYNWITTTPKKTEESETEESDPVDADPVDAAPTDAAPGKASIKTRTVELVKANPKIIAAISVVISGIFVGKTYFGY